MGELQNEIVEAQSWLHGMHLFIQYFIKILRSSFRNVEFSSCWELLILERTFLVITVTLFRRGDLWYTTPLNRTVNQKKKEKTLREKRGNNRLEDSYRPFFLQLSSQASLNRILFIVACEIAFNFLRFHCVLTNVLLLTCFYV